MPGGVARRWKDCDTRQDLFLSVDEHPVSSRKVHPLRGGVLGLMSKVVLSSLSDERHAGEQSVVPTVVEVEVRVDDHHNIAEADPRAGKCLIERPVYRREEPIWSRDRHRLRSPPALALVDGGSPNRAPLERPPENADREGSPHS